MLLERFFPSYKYDKVENIPYEILKNENIKALIFDMDNTLVNYKYEYNDNLKKWLDGIKNQSIKLYILSNSNKKDKIKKVADELDIDYINNALKPLKFGFKKVLKVLDVDKENIAVIGDQIFTDIWGGNRFGIKTILITPISQREMLITKIKRPLEQYILKKYRQLKKGSN